MSKVSLDEIVKFSKRKGFVYPSSEIYGGFAATYDFGPLGALLKKNLEKQWRYWNITKRTDMEEIEGAIFMHPKVWEASGHVGGFSDLLVEDTETKKRYRADHLIEDAGIMENAGALTAEEIDKIIIEKGIKSPDGNSLSNAKAFNLLVKTHLGPVENDTTIAYLKGESCQNIYVNWKQVVETTRRKLPFGIAQIGKVFRNEITVKQFMFRTREFEQMDVQYFCHPNEADKFYEEWKNYRFDFYTQSLGFSQDNLRWRQHDEDERVFYATDAWDIDYCFGALGFKEMEGLHHRGSYDLDQHSKFSGQDLTYLDPYTNERFNPFIVECSGGFTRIFLAMMFEYYSEEQVKEGETRIVFKAPYNLAPYKCAILPLMKKDGLGDKAKEIFASLRTQGIMCNFDESGSVGKRYRRQDENGTPWCITIDYDTLNDETVTIRHRDTMVQERVGISELGEWLNSEKF